MAYDTTNTGSTLFMDKLSHSIIKETSKTLKHYLDVKRREDAFILSPSVSAWDAVPIKARFMYGTAKEYPPLYASCYTDTDVKTCLRSIQQQQQQKSSHRSSNDLERRICREELNFHMRPHKPIAIENRQFSRLNLRPTRRPNSSSSGSTSRFLRQGLSKSTSYENNHLVDDTADILANLIKSRRNMNSSSNYASRQDTPAYVSRNTNPSPRQTDEPDSGISPEVNGTAAPVNLPRPKKPKRKTDNPSAKNMSIMREAKQMTAGILCDYKITVTTGNCNGASTDAQIRIKLYGKKGSTEFLKLEQSENHHVAFRRNQSDTFTIQTYHVGELAGITIGHDQTDAKSGWFLNKVMIEDPTRERTYDIQCNSWLSSRSDDQKLMRDFTVTTIVSQRHQSESRGRRAENLHHSDASTLNSSDRSRDSNDTRDIRRPGSHHARRRNSNQNRSNHSPPARKDSSSPSPPPSGSKIKRSASPIQKTQPTKSVAKPTDSPPISRSPSPTRPADSPPISRSPSPTFLSTKNRRNTYTRGRSKSPSSFDESRLPSVTTNDHAFQSKTSKVDIDDRRPPGRLETRTPPLNSPKLNKKKYDEEDEKQYDDDFYDDLS